jgi:hypothetical protein
MLLLLLHLLLKVSMVDKRTSKAVQKKKGKQVALKFAKEEVQR